MKTMIYKIKSITNLHVGSGETNFGVVDNLVQRDAATGFPVINASSLKGALREHCEAQGMPRQAIVHIFGSEADDLKNRQAGAYRFFDANLLAMPVRSDRTPYLMGTCPLLVKDYLLKYKLMTGAEKAPISLLDQATSNIPLVSNPHLEAAYIEDCEHRAKSLSMKDSGKDKQALSGLIGDATWALFDDSTFKTLCDNDHLPVIARNNLTPKHENLWYEQVLPRFTSLYFFVMVPDEDLENPAYQLPVQDCLVQIGANATVGYGYCEITRINWQEEGDCL